MGRRWAVILVGLGLAVFAESCRRSRYFAGPPQSGSAVYIELLDSRATRGKMRLTFRVHNNNDQELVVDRNQIAIVSPNREYYRGGDNAAFAIPPREDLDGAVTVADDDVDFRRAPGYYVRFDGLYLNGERAAVPPMPIGRPSHSPGSARAQFQPPPPSTVIRESGGTGLLSRIRRQVGRLAGPERESPGTSNPVARQRPPGPRAQLKQTGLRCAAMQFEAVNFDPNATTLMDDLLLAELQSSGFDALGPGDINAMLGFERMKEASGCDDLSCVAEIGGALGVDYLTTGKLGRLGDSLLVTLQLLDVRGVRVLARVNRTAPTEEVLPQTLAGAVQELVTQSGL